MTAKFKTKNTMIQAMGAFHRKDYMDSIRLFSDILDEQPDHKICLVSRGAAFLKLNRLDDALIDLDRAVDVYPDYARGYHLRGLAKVQRGQKQDALADFDQAIALDPNYGAAYASRAIVNQELGHDAMAADDMAAVTALTQVNLETYADQNNIWQTRHMQIEETMGTELNR